MTNSAEAEARVEASRHEMDRTMETIRERMTPGQLFDETTRLMGGAGAQIVSRLTEQAKENPLPMAVAGFGLAWLMASQGHKAGSRPWLDESPRPMGAAFDGAGETLQTMADRTGRAISDSTGHLSDSASQMADQARAGVARAQAAGGRMADRAGELGRQATSSLAQMFEREPLLIGGLALVAGLAVASALPRTEIEDQALGEAKDRLVETAKSAASDGLETVGDAAQAAYGGAKQSLADGQVGIAATDGVEPAAHITSG